MTADLLTGPTDSTTHRRQRRAAEGHRLQQAGATAEQLDTFFRLTQRAYAVLRQEFSTALPRLLSTQATTEQLHQLLVFLERLRQNVPLNSQQRYAPKKVEDFLRKYSVTAAASDSRPEEQVLPAVLEQVGNENCMRTEIVSWQNAQKTATFRITVFRSTITLQLTSEVRRNQLPVREHHHCVIFQPTAALSIRYSQDRTREAEFHKDPGVVEISVENKCFRLVNHFGMQDAVLYASVVAALEAAVVEATR